MAPSFHRMLLLSALGAGVAASACTPKDSTVTPTGSGGQGTGGTTATGTGGAANGTGGAATGGAASATGGGSATGGASVATGGGSATGGASGGMTATSGGAAGTATGGAPSGTGGRGSASGGASGAADGGAADAARDATMSVDPGTEGDGDFTAGPTYTKQTDLTAKGAPAGKSFRFSMESRTSKFYTGLDTTLLAANQRAFTRNVDVYIPAKYKDGTAAPFLVIHDGPGSLPNVKNALDNLTQDSTPAARRLPAFIAIAVANGGGDSKGSERGLEYDTMSDRFVKFIEEEVLPAVLANASIKAAYPNLALTKDPDGRATIGCSSGGAAALTMGWFRPDLFRRIITYSGTFVDQQDDDAAEEKMYPLGAWEYHSGLSLIANTDPKPLRIFLNANESDNGATAAESGHHNWVIANQRTAAALKAKKYHYRYVFGQNAGHCAGQVQDATLADTLIWVWRGYPLN